jgi:DNA polymerase-3 subunit epsilon
MATRQASASSSGPTFAAIDFETADYGRDSACAVAIVRVEGNVIVDRVHHYIRPPRKAFAFTYLHGISWEDVVDAPTFRQLWPTLREILNGLDFLAAHNASFDRSVLVACCRQARLDPPDHAFHCTVRLARAVWDVYPTKLPDVCRRLRIPLRHHHAESDAEACARIVIAAAKTGAILGRSAEASRPARPARKELNRDRLQEDRDRRGP